MISIIERRQELALCEEHPLENLASRKRLARALSKPIVSTQRCSIGLYFQGVLH